MCSNFILFFFSANLKRQFNILKHSLEEMTAEIDKPDDDLGRIRERIKALKEDHLKDCIHSMRKITDKK